MGLDLRLQQKMSQQLVMTPQLQQAIKLLQLSHLEMAQTLQHELAQNPVLEELDNDAFESAASADGPDGEHAHEAQAHGETGEGMGDGARDDGSDDSSDAGQGSQDGVAASDEPGRDEGHTDDGAYDTAPFESPYGGKDGADRGTEAPSWESTHVQATSLAEHLRWQVHMAAFSPGQRGIALYLVEEIDDDGYLQAEAVAGCAQALEVEATQVLQVLGVIQEFDPPGVGARDLAECLRLQVRQQADCSPLVRAIVEHHLKDIEGRNFGRIARAQKVSLAEVSAAVRQMAQLEPRPGRAFVREPPHYIVPDLFVTQASEQPRTFHVSVNEEGLPRLAISSYYKDACGEKFSGKTRVYVQEKLRAASWLLRSLHMRQRTMVRVMRSILHFQENFFVDGASGLRPLVLRDVAEDVGLHESTISRVTTNKYVHTPHGIFELKYFFNSTLQTLQGGRQVGSESVRQKISQMIGRENKNEPLSDQKIVDLLRVQDISIARRTVAKYRKMLNKQPSSSRRRDF